MRPRAGAPGLRQLALALRAARGWRAVGVARGRAGARVGALLLGALLLRAVPAAAQSAASVRDTLQVSNTAALAYRDSDGNEVRLVAGAAVAVERTVALALTPDRQAAVTAGGRIVLAHQLTNSGDGDETVSLTVAGPTGWGVALYMDANGDGALDAGDAVAGPTVALARGGVLALIVVVDVPAAATAAADQPVTVRAASGRRADLSVSARDLLTVGGAVPALRVTKVVDRATATAGDPLAYSISYANDSSASADVALLADTLPAGLRYVAGSARLDGAPLTEAADGDPGLVVRLSDGRDALYVQLGALAPGASGVVALGATVAADAPAGALTNLVALSAGAITVRDSAVTVLAGPELSIAKTLLGAGSVLVGEAVTYRLDYANRSAVATARQAVLVDTLPAALAFEGGDGAPAVAGQVVQWQLGDLAPGAAASLTVVARVTAASASGGIVNRATLAAAGAGPSVAAALPLTAVTPAGSVLELDKRADVADVAVGEAAPYAIALRNTGSAAIGGIVVHDRLPAGTRLITASVQGADSARTAGGELTMWVAGPLDPGAERVVRYALFVASPGAARALENRAVADASGGAVRSNEARAWVRVRRAGAATGRTLVGKVWVDRDDDGRQDPGEPGVAGARVWAADGETVVTDREGRFSLRDLLPGTHAVRIDTLGLPPGYALPAVGDEVAVVRTDGWTMPRVNFRLVPLPGADTLACACEKHGEAIAARAATGARQQAGDAQPRPVTLHPLRSDSARASEERRAFLEGPGVRFSSPADGGVVATNRLYVGVRGEPGAEVRLYDGDTQLRAAQLRADGVADFVGIELAPGPHRLRVATRNSWRRERWDSLLVHRSGPPEKLVLVDAPATVRADAPGDRPVAVRVLDAWGVPVADRPELTVEPSGVTVEAPDVAASSVGHQLRADEDGMLRVVVWGGREAAPGSLALSAGQARLAVPLQVLPSNRAMVATGVGQVGVGAAPAAFGALTVRGAVGDDAALSLTYDSRRGAADDEFFARGYDPLDASRYPTYGDGSERRLEPGAGAHAFSARLERGLDWAQLGDVDTRAMGGGRLGGYSRALTGASARLATGPLLWRGFGSVTEQSLSQVQVRGDGSSGPYVVGAGRPGTERVAIEVRARENAARLLSREELQRFVDYDVDYASGTVRLRRPVPAADAYGNPVFVVATLEQRGADAHFVGGLRLDVDAGRLLGVAPGDSLIVGMGTVRDGAAGQSLASGGAAPRDLYTADVRLRRRGIDAGAEVLSARGADSAAAAGSADVRWALPGRRAVLDAGWTRIGGGFGSTVDPRLRSALSELRLGGELRIADSSRVRVQREWQHFDAYGVGRQTTSARVDQPVLGRRVSEEVTVAGEQLGSDAATVATTVTGRATVAIDPRLDLWMEGTRALASGDSAFVRPDQLGVGAAFRVLPRTRLEGSHRFVRMPDDSTSYQLTSVGLSTEAIFGGRMWGGVERAGAARASHSAVLGWNQRLMLAHGWAVSSMVERRVGLSKASLVDPVRALPFAQPERDRWSLGSGVEWLPGADRARMSLRGELQQGADREAHRLEVAADAPLGGGAAVLTRHHWSAYSRVGVGVESGRDDRSLLGVALRPVTTAALDALLRAEWRRTQNPTAGSVLGAGGDDRRVIAGADAVWAPTPGTELAGRYAARLSRVALAAGATPVALEAHFLGARAQQALTRRWSVRTDARALHERSSGASAWSVAPSLALRIDRHFELESGYRLGTLIDRDFASGGGSGAFALLNLRFTEADSRGPATVWRERLGRER